jgi:hypothetical protein
MSCKVGTQTNGRQALCGGRTKPLLTDIRLFGVVMTMARRGGSHGSSPEDRQAFIERVRAAISRI